MQDPLINPVRVDDVLLEGSFINEDLLSVTDGAAWVLDGTSGFSNRSVTDHPESDGVWFVETANRYLHEHMNTDDPIAEIVASVIDCVVSDLRAEIGIEPTLETTDGVCEVADAVGMHELPGATLALIRWDDSMVEYYSLGDSSVLVTTQNGTDRHIEGGPQVFDEALRGVVEEYVGSNPDATAGEIRSMLRPRIEETRRYREVPGGFWCLGVNPASAKQALEGQYRIDEIEHVSLFTDGLLDIVDLFEVFDDWNSVNSFIHENGVEAVAEQLREVERTDQSLQQYPRLKPMDDIAIINLEF